MTYSDHIALPLYALPPEEAGREAYFEGHFGDKNPFPSNVPQHFLWEAGRIAACRDDDACEHENDYLDCCDGQRDLAVEMAHGQFDIDIARLRKQAADLKASLMAMAPAIAACVALTGVPVERWPGNCHGVASDFLAAGIPSGFGKMRLVRGHWRGAVAPGALFDNGAGFVPHSWISLGAHIVCDPTRFVFEGAEPYVYIGADTHYDPAGQILRLEHYALRPQPPAADGSPLHEIRICPEIIQATGLSGAAFTKGQIFWLANLPLPILGSAARSTFDAIAEAGFKGLIPIDSWTEVQSE